MKKILLTFVAAVCMAATASAQLAEGSVFPYPGGATGRLTAVNAPFTGMGFNLDSLSNAGYTIFIDISATWCNPCWQYHISKQLDTLWEQHGPTGAPGVNASTTNDVFVLFVQGEGTSHLAELYDGPGATVGSASVETPYATSSQGNWVAGTPFPMIDDTTSSDGTYGTNALDAAWHIAFFPTVYMICRDHLVHNLTQPSYSAAYAAAQATCPTTPPATGASVDAKATPYLGATYFVCDGQPSVTFQNYSTTANITAATISVTDSSGATVATVPWTGTLTPYATTNVSVPAFPGTSFSGYKYSVTVIGDINAANNGSPDSVFRIYTPANVGTLPLTEDFTGTLSRKYNFPSDGSIGLPNPSWAGAPNPSGVTSNKYLLFDFPGFSSGKGLFDFVVGNFNTDGYSSLTFEFDESYAVYTGNPTSDKITVNVSHNCGSTWLTVWTGTGTTLETHAAVSNGWVPTAAADWVHRTVNIPVGDTSNNMMLRFNAISSNSNYGWVTNLKLSGSVEGVPQVLANNEVFIAPNPANDQANISFTLTAAASVQVQVTDVAGRIVNSFSQELNAGAQNIALSTVNLPTGVYNVKLATPGQFTVKQLSVVK